MRASIRSIVPTCGRRGHLRPGGTRSGRAVLYTLSFPADRAQAQILRRNLAEIGIALEIKEFPLQVLFEKLSTPGEPFDIGRVSWGGLVDPGFLADLFNGRNIGRPGSSNWSYFNSAKYNRLLDRALSLPVGPRAPMPSAELDVQISRDAAPAIAYGVPNELTLVSRKMGYVVINPAIDLTAVCLKYGDDPRTAGWSAEDRSGSLTSSVERSLEGHPDPVCSDGDPARPVAYDQDVGDAVRARVDR